VNVRKNAHGAMGASTDDPVAAFLSAWGGSNELRHVEVDLATLEALGPSHTLPALPDLVRLTAPDPDLHNWQPWLARLSEGRAIAPTAEATWVRVADRSTLSLAEVDQALFLGQTCAGNGPLIELEDRGGAIWASQPGPADGDLELWTAQGRVAHTSASMLRIERPGDSRWAIAVFRGPDSWAVAGPLWLDGVSTDRVPVLPASGPMR